MTIGIDYIGRLGNQFFTYAFARKLMESYPQKDFHIVANFKRTANGDHSEVKAIEDFNIKPFLAKSNNIELSYGSIHQRALYLSYELLSHLPSSFLNTKAITYLLHQMKHYGLFFSIDTEKKVSVDAIPHGNIFIRGFFQDKSYFDSIRSIILDELTPIHPPLGRNKHLYEAIALPNSVCVSIRRGDFLSSENKQNYYICTPDYFKKAVSKICSLIKDPIFVFFSDDIEWVKQHMEKPEYQCFYERGDDPVWEKLRLMYSCHHFIISNSTFSWWAQYLSRREGKIVISPSRWYANPLWRSQLIDDSFIQINV